MPDFIVTIGASPGVQLQLNLIEGEPCNNAALPPTCPFPFLFFIIKVPGVSTKSDYLGKPYETLLWSGEEQLVAEVHKVIT